MSFIYTVGRSKIELALSADDIGVRFDSLKVAARAVRTSRTALRRAGRVREALPRAYGRTMLVHEAGVARRSFAALRTMLNGAAQRGVMRTLPVFIERTSGLRLVTTREIAVRFRAKASERKYSKLLAGLDLAIQRPNEFNPHQYIVGPAKDIDETIILDLANRLSEADDVVEFAAPNFLSEHRKSAKSAAAGDPLIGCQWHLNNTGRQGATQGEDVDAFPAWGVTPGGSPAVVIAIIDDGVDIAHPDLKSNIWVNPDPKAPDRNGRNFYDGDFDPRPRYFAPPYDELEGNDSHGTPCAGVAAAAGGNRRGVAGIAYGCKILPVKIFGADNLATNEMVAGAIRYAGARAQVISCSWAGPWNADLESAINDVTSGKYRAGKGCLVFCATGNEYRARIGYPASHTRAFGVGASNDKGVRSKYSNYGKGIAFVAPSSDPDRNRQSITTTDVSIPNRGFNVRGIYTHDFGGTSSATPLAAGIGALVLSVNPSLSREEAYDVLCSTADKIDQAGGDYRSGFSLKYGYGRLNAHKALCAAAALKKAKKRKPKKTRGGRRHRGGK